MMAQLVDHFLTGLTIGEGEHCPLRRKQEHRLTQLLAELLDTERKYVDDLETVSCVVDDQDVCGLAQFVSIHRNLSPSLI